MARIAARTITASLAAALALPVAAQPEAAPPAGAVPEPPGPERRVVVIDDNSLPAPKRPRGLADALGTLHVFFGAQVRVAQAVTMNSTTGPVTRLANGLIDQLGALDARLTALGQRLGIQLERGGPLGATETARAWVFEQRMQEIESLRGRALDVAFLAPLPDEMRFGQGLVNAARISGTLDDEVLRFLNETGVQLQSFVEQSRGLLSPRIRMATEAERARG